MLKNFEPLTQSFMSRNCFKTENIFVPAGGWDVYAVLIYLFFIMVKWLEYLTLGYDTIFEQLYSPYPCFVARAAVSDWQKLNTKRLVLWSGLPAEHNVP